MKPHLPKLLLAALLLSAGIATGYTVTDSTSSQNAFTNSVTGDTVTFNMTGTGDNQYLHNSSSANNTLRGNAVITQLNITNGFSYKEYIFAGSVSGTGDFTFSPSDGPDHQTYTFNGSMANYSGAMTIGANKTCTINFNNTTIGSSTEAGSITTGATSTVNLNNSTSNASINVGTLAVAGNSAVNKTVTVSDKLDVTGLTSAIAGTGTLNLNSATINISTAQYNGGNVNLDIFGSGLTVLGRDNVVISVDDIALNSRSTATWNGGTLSSVTISTVTWAGGEEATTWDTTSASWTVDSGATAFMQGDKVQFNSSATLGLASDISVMGMTVSGEGTAVALNTGNHTFTGAISVESGSALKLSGAGVSLTQVSGEGNVTLLGNSRLESGQSTAATGGLTVGSGSGQQVVFTLGTANSQSVSIESFSSVTLDKGKILYHGSGSVIKNLNVSANGGEIYITDMDNVSNHEVRLAGTTQVDGTLTLTTKWKSTVNIAQLTGQGSLVFNGGDNGLDHQASSLKLSTLANFEGSITVNKKSGTTDGTSKAVLKLTHTNASGETFHNLTLSNSVEGQNTLGGIVEIFNSDTARTTTVESLAVNGLGTIETLKSSSCWNGTININALTGTSAVLNLRSGSQASHRTVFNLGTADAVEARASVYTGTVNVVNNAASGSQRRVGLVINNDTIAQGTVINLTEASANENGNHADMGVNSSNVNVRGITTTSLLPANSGDSVFHATIVSGALSADDSDASSDNTVRTLTITTQSGDNFTANTAVKGNLNLVKKGEGRQTFSGDMSAFNQAVSVEAGELAFSNAAVLSVTDLMVKSGATLTIGSPVQSLTADSFSGARVGNHATLEGGSTLNGGLDLTGTDTLTINKISNSSTITLNGALILPDGSITLAGEILSALSGLAEGSSLNVFSGVSSLTLGSADYTDALAASADTDLCNYFSGVGSARYQLGYTGAADGGVVYIQRNVPEPATATLGLLALAALAARRRRKG